MSRARKAQLAADCKPCRVLHRLDKTDSQLARGRVPISDGRSRNLIDRELLRQLHVNFRRHSLQNIDTNFGIDLGRVFTHADQLSKRAAQSERLTRALIINLASPRKR